jgi:hypothetical protein
MNDLTGTIKLIRALANHEIWMGDVFSRGHAWADLLLLANTEDNSFWIRDHFVAVKRGQLAWSIVNLSQRWKWCREKTTSFLKHLESKGMISLEPSKSVTIISITNYACFQLEPATHLTTVQTTDPATHLTTDLTQRVELEKETPSKTLPREWIDCPTKSVASESELLAPDKKDWCNAMDLAGIPPSIAEEEWCYQEALPPTERWRKVDTRNLTRYAAYLRARWQNRGGFPSSKKNGRPAAQAEDVQETMHLYRMRIANTADETERERLRSEYRAFKESHGY